MGSWKRRVRTVAAAAALTVAVVMMRRNMREVSMAGQGGIKRTSHSQGEVEGHPKKEKRKDVRWATKMVKRRRWSRTVKLGTMTA